MSDSNEEKYQLEDYKWIQFQILWTNIINKKCMADTKENCRWDLGSQRVKIDHVCWHLL